MGRFLGSISPAPLPRQAWLLGGVVFVCRLGAMVKLFMAIYLKSNLGMSIELIGVLLSSYGAGLVIGSYLWGVASDHYSSKHLTLLLIMLAAGTLLTQPTQTTAPALIILLIASGVFDGGIRTLHQRLILDFCPVAIRDQVQALSRVAINLGMACAGLLGGILSDWSMNALFQISAALLVLANATLYLGSRGWQRIALMEAPAPDSRHHSPYRNPRYLCFLTGCTLLALAYEPIYSMLGNYLIEHYRLPSSVIGWQFALNGVMVVALQIPISTWSSAWGVRNQLLAGSLLLGMGTVLIPVGSTTLHISACTIIWTLGELLFMPAMNLHVMQQAEGRRSGHYFGLFAMFWSTGTLLSPLIASQIYGRLGGSYLWIAACALSLCAMLLISLATTRRTA
ncbi:MFS transporter [Pseudomonas putida]